MHDQCLHVHVCVCYVCVCVCVCYMCVCVCVCYVCVCVCVCCAHIMIAHLFIITSNDHLFVQPIKWWLECWAK